MLSKRKRLKEKKKSSKLSERRRRNLAEYLKKKSDSKNNKGKKISRLGRKPANPEMEVALINWIQKNLAKGLRISQANMRRKAKEIIRKTDSKSSFTASKGWIEKFLRRHQGVWTMVEKSNRSKVCDISSESEGNEGEYREKKKGVNSSK